MIRSSSLLWALSQLLVSGVLAVKVTPSFENTGIIRQVDLDGATVHVTTSYTVRSLSKNNGVYYISIPKSQDDVTRWIDAKVKGSNEELPISKYGIEAMLSTSEPVVYYSIDLPKPLDANETLNIAVFSIEAHASYPLPSYVGQTDTQSLMYETPAIITSPYPTLNQRTKVKAPTPTIHSYTEPKSLEKYASEGVATKSKSTVTYGPYTNLPASDSASFAAASQEVVKVHYEFGKPVLVVDKLRRAAEISHWGSNLNINDDIILRNGGAGLKGQFSRLEHQRQQYYQKSIGHGLQSFNIHLPGGARDVYYTDIVGNVSTSRFRPAPPKSRTRASEKRVSTLEVRPRYPLLGGWNFTFTLGWDTPLEDSAVFDQKTGEYVVAIPFFTNIPSSVVDDAEVKIIFPEGAENLAVHTPFAVDSTVRGTHVTYLDTIGRPSLTLYKKYLTEKHTGSIYVTYTLSSRAHYAKPVAITTASLLVFSVLYILRRVDFSITK